MGMLGVVFLFVELGQLLYAMASSTDYLAALHEAAATAFTGPGITSTDAFSKALQLVLASYCVVSFAPRAGSLGTFFLQAQDDSNRGVSASSH